MLGFGAVAQFALDQGPADQAVSMSWFAPLSEPVRIKRGLRPSLQQPSAFNPRPFVPFGWFRELSKPPILARRGLRPGEQQPFAFEPPPRVSFAWFSPLSEPARTKRGLNAARQQFLAAPSRLLPTPGVSGVLDATETKDSMLTAATVFNQPISGELGVQVLDKPPGEVGVAKAAPAVSGRLSIRILKA
jgi:hypothetical protein